jgi:hypothetical protein
LLRTATLGILCVVLGSCRGSLLEVGNDDPPPVDVPPDLAERCRPLPGTARTFESSSALERALIGRWFRCRGVASGILYSAAIELTDNHEWFALIDDGKGALVRAKDPARHGRWTGQAPLTVAIGFENLAVQTLVVVFDPDGRHFTVAHSTFENVDVAYVRE